MKNKVLEIINRVIADEDSERSIKIENDQLDISFNSLGIDSLTYIHIIVEIEEYFNVSIPDDMLALNQLNTVNKMIELLKNNKKE